ncbi:MAG: LysR family transcriptional regulator [Eubacteriales bacterium]
MNTLHFKYAVEIEKTGSITQAADNLFMAQPNLSKAIKELEESLGIAIFKRNSNGVVPTKKGTEFLVFAKNILSQIEKMEALNQPENIDKQCISISIPRSSYIAAGITNFISELDQNNNIEITIKETNSMRTTSYVFDGQFNLGVIRFQTVYEKYFLDYLAEKHLRFELIWKFEYLVLMSKKHPLADKPKIEYNELSMYTEILHGDNKVPYISANDTIKPEEISQTKRKIYIYERGSQFDILTHIPTTYIWSSPIPCDLLNLYGLVQRKCEIANNQYKDLCIYRKGYKLTELDKKFISKLYDAKNDVAFLEYT